LTVKAFITLIDSTLLKPFFVRRGGDAEQSQATWHNEKKGVIVIENYYRKEEEQGVSNEEPMIEERINYSDEE
jgi:hypothetical protein